jgi:16S rRNA processing protein RimM
MTGTRKSRGTQQPAGSPQSGEPEFLVIGKLRAPHGLRGELLMDVITDFPERIRAGRQVYVGDDHRPLKVRSQRTALKGMLIGFQGFDTPEAAGELRNQFLYVSQADLPALPEGEYYHHQLIGLRVVRDDGQELGRLVEILDTSANDVYVVRPAEGPDTLLPAIDPVIVNIDLEQQTITVHLLPGM